MNQTENALALAESIGGKNGKNELKYKSQFAHVELFRVQK